MRKKFEEKKTNVNEAAAAAAVGDFCLFNISIQLKLTYVHKSGN